ncbi:MAG TPA: alkaline phosphatase family protein [Vicinamibacterales bacterium]|nr:alkaline phosphatase family protein [Vicinamibacterales bacterium]
MATPPDPRVDELREQLKALGYLDARMDRFVLGGAARRSQAVALAAAASARLGLLAGLLLGPAAAIGLRARVPGLVTSGLDAIVLAAYLGVLFAVATGLVAAAAILAGAAMARRSAASAGFSIRARRIAAAAGLMVGLGCLLYLSLWWRAAMDAGSMSVAWTGAILAIAVAISLLLGHGVMVTVLAFLARSGLARSLQPGLPLSSRRAIVPLAALSFFGALAILIAAPRGRVEPAPPPLTVIPTGQRVVVIAVDGVDESTLDRLRRAGRLPTFDRLLAQAVATMTSDADRDPARVWTTIATGQPPERHGVRSLETRRVAGLEGRLQPDASGWSAITAATDLLRLTRPTIASGETRLIPAFWEVAARAGLRAAVVHWWATWPAPEDLGIVISDRAILRLEHGGAQDAEIAPGSLYESLRTTWADRRARAAAKSAAALMPDAEGDLAAAVRRSAEIDATLVDLSTDSHLGTPDLLVLYLPGLDIVQHALFEHPGGGTLSPSVAADRLSALERYYMFVDDSLVTLLGTAPVKDRLVVLVTQPGRVERPGAGFVALSGSTAETVRLTAPLTGVAPTVLHALGVPVARDLASSAMIGLFSRAFADAHPVREVATYGARRSIARTGSGAPLDREMIERMRSLGYVR